MNCEFALNLHDLETLLAKGNCSCHFINPNKTRIILWQEVKDNVVTYYLRIGIQKFISYPLTDKNGATYWRFKPWEKETAAVTTEPDPITKFQQRQAQVKDHAANNSVESAVTNS